MSTITALASVWVVLSLLLALILGTSAWIAKRKFLRRLPLEDAPITKKEQGELLGEIKRLVDEVEESAPKEFDSGAKNKVRVEDQFEQGAALVFWIKNPEAENHPLEIGAFGCSKCCCRFFIEQPQLRAPVRCPICGIKFSHGEFLPGFTVPSPNQKRK